MPAISVIVPAYNAEKTILETIGSIQAQTFSDFELIVINDGSTDGTVELLNTIDDPRLKVFSYENGGLPVARNRGIDRATGEFLSFIDADDLWTPDKLERQYAALQNNPHAGVAYSWTAFIDENSDFLYAWEPLYWQGNVYSQLLVRNFISSGSNILVRRAAVDAIGPFDPNLKSVEDWDFYLRLAARYCFAVVPDYQILYRRSSQSMAAKVDVMEEANLIVINRAFQAAPAELKPLKNKTLANVYRYLAKQCLYDLFDRQGAVRASQKLARSVRLYPKIVLSKETQRLILKLLIARSLPLTTAARLLAFISSHFPMVRVPHARFNQKPS